MADSIFTEELIKTHLEIVAKASPRPWKMQGTANIERILNHHHMMVAETHNQNHEADGQFMIIAANNYPEALQAIRQLKDVLGTILKIIGTYGTPYVIRQIRQKLFIKEFCSKFDLELIDLADENLGDPNG